MKTNRERRGQIRSEKKLSLKRGFVPTYAVDTSSRSSSVILSLNDIKLQIYTDDMVIVVKAKLLRYIKNHCILAIASDTDKHFQV